MDLIEWPTLWFFFFSSRRRHTRLSGDWSSDVCSSDLSGRIGHGNHAIRHILCECANAARMTKSTLAAKYRSLMVRKSHKKAIVALAHKMLRLIYVLLTRRQPYLDRAIDYASLSARKNAPRWIRQLKAIGKWPEPPAASRAATAH